MLHARTTIVWDGKKLHGFNASGRSPAGWTLDYFKGQQAMPVRGWNTVTVPGCVQAWVDLHAKFGKLPFKKLFERAICYGREGFLVDDPRDEGALAGTLDRLADRGIRIPMAGNAAHLGRRFDAR